MKIEHACRKVGYQKKPALTKPTPLAATDYDNEKSMINNNQS